jgi:hypothetical protein
MGIFVRSLHYPSSFNFSAEQAMAGIRSMEIWRNKELVLIGPEISFQYLGRNLFQGSITYYFQLLFLLPAKFNPLIASYLFTVFSSIMVIPLYYGVKLLHKNKSSAFFVSTVYLFLPFYIYYTHFFWNPNFQFALTPLLVLSMGLFAKYKNKWYFFAISFLAGLLLLFHYQYAIIIAGLFVFYFFIKKVPVWYSVIFVAGFVCGFSPLLIFELRNHFYNLQTILLYIQHWDKVIGKGGGSSLSNHYILTSSLFVFIALTYVGKKWLSIKIQIVTGILLFICALVLYGPVPKHAFGMADNWNYTYEEKAYAIIRSQSVIGYNIVNEGYDTLARVQKYLLKRDNVQLDYDDYYKNKYLYVISNRPNYMEESAYEVNTFKPSKLVKKWKLNHYFNLYLMERLEEEGENMVQSPAMQ